MPTKPILIYKLTPTQIALVDRLAHAENGMPMDKLDYGETIVWQELDKLGIADMKLHRRKAVIVLTDLGAQVRSAGYLSTKPVVRLTEAQIAALRFLASGRRHFNDIPAYMKEPARRLRLRGWATSEDVEGHFWVTLTDEGWALLKLLDH